MYGKFTAAAGVLGLLLAASAWADPPTIGNINPLGVRRGGPVAVTISGGNLAGNPRLVAPFPAQVESAEGSDGGNFKFKVSVPASVPIGVYPVRVVTDDGISNPFLLAVGQLPQVAEAEDNGTIEQAQAVPSPAVVEGQVAGNDVDFFRFPGKKGQRIVIDAQCARIGSGVDPTIRLMTAARGYVASAEDTPGLMTDARLTAVLPEDGDYVVEISDTRYAGGNRPVYRLVIGPVPSAEEIYPLGGRRGETVGFELRGGTLADLALAAARLDDAPGADTAYVRVAARQVGLDSDLDLHGLPPVELGDLPELREPSAADAPPLKAHAPVTINGRIDPAGDEDKFVVAVTPGKSYRVKVVAAELGSALDGVLQVLKADGGQVAQADDTTAKAARRKGGAQQKNQNLISPDPSLTFKAPDGVNEVTLVVRDLEGRGGVGFPYRLTVEPASPTFHIALNDSEVSIPKGGHAAIAAAVDRDGYNGPITVTIANPPAGLSVRPGTVGEGQPVAVLSVSATADAAFGPVVLDVVANAQGPEGPIDDRATKTVVFAQQTNLPINEQEQAGLAAAPAQPKPVALGAPADAVEVAHGGSATVPIKANRVDNAEGELKLTALPLPPGLAVPEAKVEAKAGEASLTVNAAPEAALGPVTIGVVAKGKVGDKDLTLSTPAIRLNVVRPAELTLDVKEAQVKPGATAEVKGKVVRKGGYKEPINVKLNGLPAGLKSDPVTVAPDATDFTLKIEAAADAADATANAQVALELKVAGKDYSVPPAPLAVKVAK